MRFNFIIAIAIALLSSVQLIGQEGCKISDVYILLKKDYQFSYESIEGTVAVKGIVLPNSTISLALYNEKMRRFEDFKYVPLINQIGTFSFSVDPSVPSGWYKIVAYHPESSDLYALKKFFILNPDDKPVQADQVTFQVHPEGGSFVRNTTQRILIQSSLTVNNATIKLTDNTSVSASFKDNYTVIDLPITDSAKLSISYDVGRQSNLVQNLTFPATSETGIKATETREMVRLDLIGDRTTGKLIVNSKKGDIVYDVSSLPLDLPKDLLPKGLISLRMTRNTKEISKRHIHNSAVSPFKIAIELTENANTNEEQALSVSALDLLSRPFGAISAVSITQDYFQPSPGIISSDLSFINEYWIQQLLDVTDSQTTNNLLIAATIELQNAPFDASRCLPLGVLISGTLQSSNNESETVTMSIPGLLPGVMQTNAKNGVFKFPPLRDIYFNKAYLIADGQPVSLDPQIAPSTVVPTSIEKPNATYINHLLSLHEISSMYGSKQLKAKTQQENAVSVYDAFDYQIPLDEFVYFPDMRSVVKEIVPYVFFKKKKIMVFSEEQRRTYEGRPLILLDGKPVGADSAVLQLDPASIDHIDVINKRRNLVPIGSIAQFGVVAFYTKERNAVSPGVSQTKIPLYAERSSSYVIPKKVNVNYPNISDLLLWQPLTYLNEKPFSFRTSDLASPATISVTCFHPDLGATTTKYKLPISSSDVQ